MGFLLSVVLKWALYSRNSQLPFPVSSIISPPRHVSLACPGMEAHYFETRLFCLGENSLPRGCVEDLVWQSIRGILCSVPRLCLVAKVSAHVPNSQTGLSRTIWLPLTLMLMLHDSVTVRIISGVGWLTYHPFPLDSVSPYGSYTLSTQHLSHSKGLGIWW